MGKYTKPARKASKKGSLYVAIIAVVLLSLIAVSALALGDRGSQPGSTLVVQPNREIDAAEAYQLYQAGVFTLDVRTGEEYQSGHIPGSVLIPLDELAQRAGELPAGEPILIYCRSGNRSLQAMNLLENAGFQNLSSLDGGINDWVAAGYPVE